MRPGALLAAAAFLLVAGCLTGGELVGQPAPAFAFVSSDGVYVNETTYLGKFVVLDLMATWCGPCKLEVAHLREVQALHGDDVVILSIGTDPTETIADLEAFGEEHGATWPYAIDRDGAVKRAFGMRIIPKLVIIDPQGTVVFEREGEVLPAAMTRVIDPSARASSAAPILAGAAGLALGFLAAHNPYRRVHRDGEGGGPTLAAIGALFALALLAWPFAGLASTRATYGSLAVGALALGAALWWLRARRKLPEQPQGKPWQRASDRAYELAPGFAAALVMALVGVGAGGFFAPLFGFLTGATVAYLTRARLSAWTSEALGVLGLAAAGVGLLTFGARVFLA